MPGELKAAKDALVAGLAVALPGRVVTRSWLPMSARNDAELVQGVVSVVGLGESDFATYRGRSADLGTLDMVLVGQLKVGSSEAPQALEEAEDGLAEQVKAWLNAEDFDAPVRACVARSYKTSGQTEFPYGWVVFRLEVQT